MTLKLLLPVAMAFAAADMAHAQSVVIGDSDARLCYEHVLSSNLGSDDAIRTCQSALRNKDLSAKNKASTYVNMGILQSRAKDYEGSLVSYAMAEELRPALPDVYINRAVSLIYMSRFQDSADASSHALELGTKKHAKVLVNRAMAYEGLNQHKLAYQDLKSAIEINPKWSVAREAISNYKVVSKTS